MIERDVPQLRIVERDLWDAVKRRQADVMLGPQATRTNPWDRCRPRYLLSGLITCGACGGGYVQISKTHLGCATSRNKGTCFNRLGISRQALERTILNGLKTHLMDPELFKEFCAEFIKEVNRLRQDQAAQRSRLEAELARIERRIRKIVDAIADGVPARSLRDELLGLEARQDEVTAKLAASPDPKIYLAPGMAEIYRQKIGELHEVITAGSEQPGVYEALRSLIDRIALTPSNGALTIDLHGEIAEILKLSAGGKKHGAETGQAAKQ